MCEGGNNNFARVHTMNITMALDLSKDTKLIQATLVKNEKKNESTPKKNSQGSVVISSLKIHKPIMTPLPEISNCP